jgi:hypothetical protein
LNLNFFRWDGKNVGSMDSAERLTEVAGGQQMIVKIAAIENQNVEVAIKLTMLEAVIEKMKDRNGGSAGRGLGHQACLITLWGDVHRNSGCASDQQRLIAELVCFAVWIDTKRGSAAAPVATREHVNVESTTGERSSQSNGKWSFAGAARGETADAEHGSLQMLYAFEPGAQAQFAKCDCGAVEWIKRQ